LLPAAHDGKFWLFVVMMSFLRILCLVVYLVCLAVSGCFRLHIFVDWIHETLVIRSMNRLGHQVVSMTLVARVRPWEALIKMIDGLSPPLCTYYSTAGCL
jgi:hypothetical protein